MPTSMFELESSLVCGPTRYCETTEALCIDLCINSFKYVQIYEYIHLRKRNFFNGCLGFHVLVQCQYVNKHMHTHTKYSSPHAHILARICKSGTRL